MQRGWTERLAATSVAIVVASCAVATTETSIFVPTRVHVELGAPWFVAAADLDHDGNMDLVAATRGLESWRGHGDGTFSRVQHGTLAEAGVWASGYTGDDADLDLVRYVPSTGELWRFESRGDGSIVLRERRAWGTGFVGMQLADVNRDGRDDLIIAHPQRDALQVALAAPDGSFADPQVMNMPATGLIVVTDLNGDERPDLIAQGEAGGRLYTALGNGDGTFERAVEHTIADFPDTWFLLGVGDFDGDAALDLVLYEWNESRLLVVARGDGSGSFLTPTAIAPFDDAPSVVVDDVNGDAQSDLVVISAVSPGVSEVRWLRGDGRGGFAEGARYGLGLPVGVPVLADIDGNGVRDLLLGGGEPFVEVIFDVGVTARRQPAQHLNSGNPSFSPHVGDANGDLLPDVFHFADNPPRVTVCAGIGNGRLAAPVAWDLADVANWSVVGDLNGDGRTDVVYTHFGVDARFVRWGDVNDILSDEHVLAGVDAIDGRFDVLDADGDGLIDLVGWNAELGALVIVYGRGGGTFSAPSVLPAPCALTGVRRVVEDPARRAVVLMRCAEATDVAVFTAQRDGTFDATIARTPLPSADRLHGGDVNGDGVLDLLLADLTDVGRDVQILLGAPDGSFDPGPVLMLGPDERVVDCIDLDRAGRDQIIVADDRTSSFARCTLRGVELTDDRTLRETFRVIPGGDGALGRFADLDRDGAPDFVYTDHRRSGESWGEDSDFLSILFNQHTACAADLDGSAVVDLADLQLVLGAWGVCDVWCAPDFDGDGVIGHSDVITLLGRWGPCPGR